MFFTDPCGGDLYKNVPCTHRDVPIVVLFNAQKVTNCINISPGDFPYNMFLGFGLGEKTLAYWYSTKRTIRDSSGRNPA